MDKLKIKKKIAQDLKRLGMPPFEIAKFSLDDLDIENMLFVNYCIDKIKKGEYNHAEAVRMYRDLNINGLVTTKEVC